MVQSFKATLKNGKITWDATIQIPEEAKVKITILGKKKSDKKLKDVNLSEKLRGALSHLSREEKDKMYQELADLRNEWERFT